MDMPNGTVRNRSFMDTSNGKSAPICPASLPALSWWSVSSDGVAADGVWAQSPRAGPTHGPSPSVGQQQPRAPCPMLARYAPSGQLTLAPGPRPRESTQGKVRWDAEILRRRTRPNYSCRKNSDPTERFPMQPAMFRDSIWTCPPRHPSASIQSGAQAIGITPVHINDDIAVLDSELGRLRSPR